jgi:hypothetical protein
MGIRQSCKFYSAYKFSPPVHGATLTQFIILGIRQSCKIYSTGKLPPSRVAHARKGSELIRGGGKTAMVCSSPAAAQPTRAAQEVPHGCVLTGQEGTRGGARSQRLGAGRCFVRIERVINHLYY